MLNKNYICAVDIGSSKLSACCVQVRKKDVVSAAFAHVQSKGVRDGVIIDSVELVSALSSLIKEIKKQTGFSIKYIYTALSGRDIVIKRSNAIIPLAERGNKVITVSDIRRVNEQARILGSTLDEEIIHMIPVGYNIDAKQELLNPLGLYGHRLESEVLLICAKLAALQGLSRAVNQSGCEIRDISFSGLIASRAVMNGSLKSGYSVVCDIGYDITELLVFSPSGLRSIDILPWGGNHITEEISNVLKVPLELAEEIKRSYGIVGNPDHIGEDKEILIKKTALYKPIKQRLVAQVVSQKAKDLCASIKEAVEKRVRLYEIKNFSVIGRSICLEGFIESLENTLGIGVHIGRLSDEHLPRAVKGNSALSGQNYLLYLTVVGIVAEVLGGAKDQLKTQEHDSRNPIVRAVNRFRDVYQEYF
jgi:cell division protein FtsA